MGNAGLPGRRYGSDQVIVQRYLVAGWDAKMAQSLIFAGLLQIPVLAILYLLGLGVLRSITCRYMRLCWRPWRTLFNACMIRIWCFRIPAECIATGSGGPGFCRTLRRHDVGVFLRLELAEHGHVHGLSGGLRRSPAGREEVTLRGARWITLAWGAVVTLAAIGVYFANMGPLLQTAAAIIGFFSGPLLGMFLLGILRGAAIP